MNTLDKSRHRSQTKKRISEVFKYLILALYSLVSIVLIEMHPGPLGSLLVFLSVVMAMVYMALSRTTSYSYIFLSFFLFMGFWSKLAFNNILDIALIEPSGDFAGDMLAWESALDTITMAIIGVVLAKILFDRFISAKRPIEDIASITDYVTSGYYIKHRTIIWLFTTAVIIIINIANYKYSFYVIGIKPEVVLPFHLNVVMAWLTYFGMAMWLTVLVQWETHNTRKATYAILILVIVEAFAAGATTLSRIIFLLHAFPMLIYIYFSINEEWRERLRIKNTAFLILFVVAFITNIFYIQEARTSRYTQPEAAYDHGIDIRFREVYTGKDVMPDMSNQIIWLFISRWVGLEGVQAVSAYPGRGIRAFMNVLEEEPHKGVKAIYQKISKSHYKLSDKYTFLTIPGVIAILGLSGSWLVILFGMFLLALLLMLTENLAQKYIPGKPLAIFIGLNMAFTLSQMNFPYLTLIYIVQLWVALLVIYLLQKLLFQYKNEKT